MRKGPRGYWKKPYYNKFNDGGGYYYKNNNNYGGYKKNYKKYKNYDDRDEEKYHQSNEKNENNIEKVVKSDEKGFTGNPDNWFSDEEFFKSLPGHSDMENKKDYYFNSYSSYYIHEQMLKDRTRTGTYQDAILKNPDIFKDKIVLDIGSGTGILSIFAAKAGAKHVYGIEFADIADYANEIIKKNNLSEKITIIKSKVEDVKLPVEKVDIIISEWMGYFLLYESMLDTVLYARDKWLNKDGYMLPDHATITLAGIEDTDYKSSKINFWDNVYGVDMSCFKNAVISEPLVEVCPQKLINSSSCRILDIDLYTVKKEDLDFSSKYEITFTRDNDRFSGLVAWFDTGFTKLTNKFNLTTSPYQKSTHWSQTIFYTKKDLKVNKGDKITGSIAVKKAKINFRQLDIKISYNISQGKNEKGEEQKESWYQLYKIA
jgi:protein arginine N-methyltransferase 1